MWRYGSIDHITFSPRNLLWRFLPIHVKKRDASLKHASMAECIRCIITSNRHHDKFPNQGILDEKLALPRYRFSVTDSSFQTQIHSLTFPPTKAETNGCFLAISVIGLLYQSFLTAPSAICSPSPSIRALCHHSQLLPHAAIVCTLKSASIFLCFRLFFSPLFSLLLLYLY